MKIGVRERICTRFISTIGQWKCEYLKENKHSTSTSTHIVHGTHTTMARMANWIHWVDGRLLLGYRMIVYATVDWLASLLDFPIIIINIIAAAIIVMGVYASFGSPHAH